MAGQARTHTRAEILSQPEIWPVVLDELASAAAKLPAITDFTDVVFTGCGSTHYLSMWAARHCQRRHDVGAVGVPASELLLEPGTWLRPRATFVVAVSRSGETTETVRAVAEVRRHVDPFVVAITCAPRSSLAALADVVLPATAAQERSIVQTRSFTSMMLAAALLVEGPPPPMLGAQLAAAGQHVLQEHADRIDDLARDPDLDHTVYLGLGPRFGLACEAMLKMKEMALQASEAYHTLEVRHGPMSTVGARSLVVGIVPAGHHPHEHAVVADMQALGARTLTVQPGGLGAATLPLPADLPAAWGDVCYLPPLQLLACDRALHRGLNPDEPANLDAVVQLGAV